MDELGDCVTWNARAQEHTKSRADKRVLINMVTLAATKSSACGELLEGSASRSCGGHALHQADLGDNNVDCRQLTASARKTIRKSDGSGSKLATAIETETEAIAMRSLEGLTEQQLAAATSGFQLAVAFRQFALKQCRSISHKRRQLCCRAEKTPDATNKSQNWKFASQLSAPRSRAPGSNNVSSDHNYSHGQSDSKRSDDRFCRLFQTQLPEGVRVGRCPQQQQQRHTRISQQQNLVALFAIVSLLAQLDFCLVFGSGTGNEELVSVRQPGQKLHQAPTSYRLVGINRRIAPIPTIFMPSEHLQEQRPQRRGQLMGGTIALKVITNSSDQIMTTLGAVERQISVVAKEPRQSSIGLQQVAGPSHLERLDFGQRLTPTPANSHLLSSAKERANTTSSMNAFSVDSRLARTIRQTNAYQTANNSLVGGNGSINNGANLTISDDDERRADYETTRSAGANQSQQQLLVAQRRDSVLTNLFKSRLPKATAPLLDSWTKLLTVGGSSGNSVLNQQQLTYDSNNEHHNQHPQQVNVSHSIGVAHTNISDAQEFILSPSSAQALTLQDNGNSRQPLAGTMVTRLPWPADSAQGSFSIGIVIKPKEADESENSVEFGSKGNNNSINGKGYQVIDLSGGSNSSVAPFQLQSGSIVSSDYQPLNSTAAASLSSADPLQPDWQASDIEHVIHTGKLAHSQREAEADAGREQQQGKWAAATGEQLRGHEHLGHWRAEKYGDEQESSEAKKGAKEGAKWLDDLAHNKHGWKNVYHKEEYAQHQKFHDVFRDKNWDNKRAKVNQSGQYNSGNQFNASLTKSFFDKNRHGTKYDYSKGSDWKRHEDSNNYNEDDDELHLSGISGAASISGSSVSHGDDSPPARMLPSSPSGLLLRAPPLQSNSNGEPDRGASAQRITRGDEGNGAGGGQQSSGEPNEGESSGDDEENSGDDDDFVIEQMKDKLERLSGSTDQMAAKHKATVVGGRLGVGPQLSTLSAVGSTTNSSSSRGVDYEPDWRPSREALSPGYSGNSEKRAPQTVRDVPNARTRRNKHRALTGRFNGQQVSHSSDVTRNGSPSFNQHVYYPSVGSGATMLGGGGDDDDANNEIGLDKPSGVGLDSASFSGAQKYQQQQPELQQATVGGTTSRKDGELRLKLELDLGKSKEETKGGGSDGSSSQKSRSRSNSTEGGNRGSLELPYSKSYSGGGWKRPDRDHHSGRNDNQAWRQQQPLRFNDKTSVVSRDQSSSPYLSKFAISSQHKLSNSLPGGDWQAKTMGKQHQKQQQQQKFGGNRSHLIDLGGLTHVLPSRPIFVRHLQMNGGIVLGKVHEMSTTNTNKAASRSRQQEPQMPTILDSGNDDSMFSPLSAFTIGQHGFGDASALAPLQDEDSLLGAPIKHQRVAPAGPKEYLVLLGADSNAEATAPAGGLGQSSQPAEQAHTLAGEPSVIFEAAASTTNTIGTHHQVQPASSLSTYQQQHTNEGQADGLMIEDQQGFTFNGDPSQPLESSQQPHFFAFQQSDQLLPHRPASLANSLRDHGLQHLLKAANSVNYANAILMSGQQQANQLFGATSSPSTSFVAPTVQQAFGRLFRLQRALGTSPSVAYSSSVLGTSSLLPRGRQQQLHFAAAPAHFDESRPPVSLSYPTKLAQFVQPSFLHTDFSMIPDSNTQQPSIDTQSFGDFFETAASQIMPSIESLPRAQQATKLSAQTKLPRFSKTKLSASKMTAVASGQQNVELDSDIRRSLKRKKKTNTAHPLSTSTSNSSGLGLLMKPLKFRSPSSKHANQRPSVGAHGRPSYLHNSNGPSKPTKAFVAAAAATMTNPFSAAFISTHRWPPKPMATTFGAKLKPAILAQQQNKTKVTTTPHRRTMPLTSASSSSSSSLGHPANQQILQQTIGRLKFVKLAPALIATRTKTFGHLTQSANGQRLSGGKRHSTAHLVANSFRTPNSFLDFPQQKVTVNGTSQATGKFNDLKSATLTGTKTKTKTKTSINNTKQYQAPINFAHETAKLISGLVRATKWT